MSDVEPQQRLSRRKFLRHGLQGAAVAAAAAAAGAVVARHAFNRQANRASPKANPFAYRIDHWKHTNPQLIGYELVGRFRSPREEPRRIAIGPEDRLYLAAGNYISVLGAEGAVLSEIALTAPARCLAIAADGGLYAGLRDHIESFDPTGQRRAVWDAPGPRAWFTGLAVGKEELYAADAGNRVVLRYDRSGKLLGRIGEKNKERNIPGFIVPSPFFDLELAPDGLLRVANPGRHQVEAYSAHGDLEFAWGKASAAIDGFCGCCNPVNLALLPEGRCVTCEKGLPRVKVYSAEGNFESVVAGPESFAENAKVCALDDTDCTRGGLDAAVDSRGRIHILDLVAGKVRIMARKGTPSYAASPGAPHPRAG